MADTVFGVLKKQLQEDIERLTDVLASGQCAALSDYKFMAGQVRGLTVAMNNIDTLAQKLEDNDDD